MKITAAFLSFLLLTTISPERLVKRADLIVRVTALGYFRPPKLPRIGRGASATTPAVPEAPVGTVRFHIDEIIKGKWTSETIDVAGRVVQDDDFNGDNVPYGHARKAPDDYVSGREYLLILRGGEPTSSEQIHGANDAWVKWIRARVKKESR